MTHAIYFLQNAWSPVFAGGTWPRPSWLRALERSRSGQRLRVLLDDFDLCENTTPLVGATPDSVIPPDDAHILAVLAARKPTVVVACGKQAETALARLWNGALLAVPHPAHRLLTDDLYRQARLLLADDLTERVALRQLRGRSQCVVLPQAKETPQTAVKATSCDVGSDTHDGDVRAVGGTVAAQNDGTLTEIQTVLYARFGVVVEPLPPSPRQHTDAERRALDWQAHKYVHGEFRQSVRAFRRWLESQQLNSDGENE